MGKSLWVTCDKPREYARLTAHNETRIGKQMVAEMWGGHGVLKRVRHVDGERVTRETWMRMRRANE